MLWVRFHIKADPLGTEPEWFCHSLTEQAWNSALEQLPLWESGKQMEAVTGTARGSGCFTATAAQNSCTLTASEMKPSPQRTGEPGEWM